MPQRRGGTSEPARTRQARAGFHKRGPAQEEKKIAGILAVIADEMLHPSIREGTASLKAEKSGLPDTIPQPSALRLPPRMSDRCRDKRAGLSEVLSLLEPVQDRSRRLSAFGGIFRDI